MDSVLATATPYAVASESSTEGDLYRLVDSERNAWALVSPALGNNCVAYRSAPQEGASDDALNVVVPPRPLARLRDVPFCGGIPVLFPFPNRVRNGTYPFGGRSYRMERLQELSQRWDECAHQAIHGLVDQRPWTVVSATADGHGASISCALDWSNDPLMSASYPFPGRIALTHRLVRGVLVLEVAVENRGDLPMPMGFGIHPWFPAAVWPRLELPADIRRITSERRARTRVLLPCGERWELERCMPTGQRRPVTENAERWDLRTGRALEDRSYDDIWSIAGTPQPRGTTASIIDGDTAMRIDIAADARFREWVLYAPTDRMVAVLEPYTCVTDAPNLAARGVDSGLIVLDPGARWEGRIALAPMARGAPPLEASIVS